MLLHIFYMLIVISEYLVHAMKFVIYSMLLSLYCIKLVVQLCTYKLRVRTTLCFIVYSYHDIYASVHNVTITIPS